MARPGIVPGGIAEDRYFVRADGAAFGLPGIRYDGSGVLDVLPEPFHEPRPTVHLHRIGPGTDAVAEYIFVEHGGLEGAPVGAVFHEPGGRRAQQHLRIILVVPLERLHPKPPAHVPVVEVAVVVVGVQLKDQTPLFQSRLAANLLCLPLHPVQRRH